MLDLYVPKARSTWADVTSFTVVARVNSRIPMLSRVGLVWALDKDKYPLSWMGTEISRWKHHYLRWALQSRGGLWSPLPDSVWPWSRALRDSKCPWKMASKKPIRFASFWHFIDALKDTVWKQNESGYPVNMTRTHDGQVFGYWKLPSAHLLDLNPRGLRNQWISWFSDDVGIM